MPDRSEAERIGEEIARPSGQGGGDPFAAAVRATRMPMIVTDPRRADNPIVFANEAFVRLTGYARDEILGRNCRFLQGPGTDRSEIAKVREAIERRRPVEVELVNYRKDESRFWNRLFLAPVFDEATGELTYFFASQLDVTLEKERVGELQRRQQELEAEVERRTREVRLAFRALQDSRDRLTMAQRAAHCGIWDYDPASGAQHWSPEMFDLWGIEPPPSGEPPPMDALLGTIDGADAERLTRALEASWASGAELEETWRIEHPRRGPRWLTAIGQAVRDPRGRPLRLSGITLDVTDRRRAEEHARLLVNELNHRVKNTLATVQSIAAQTLRGAPTPEAARGALDARLVALSGAHDILTRERWDGADIGEVVSGAVEPHDDRNGRFRIEGPRLRLQPRTALAVAMALHELCTNAAKYGALSAEGGRVSVTWDVSGFDGHRRLLLRWREHDGPAVAPPAGRGFGSRLIERGLALELGGEARILFEPAGVVCTIEAPLAAVG